MTKKWFFALFFLILGLGGAIGYAVFRAWKPEQEADPSTAQTPGTALVIDVNKEPQVGESGIEDHRDFPFRNPSEKELTAQLIWTDCNCLHFRICLAPESWQGLSMEELRHRAEKPEVSLKWEELEKGGTHFTIPPKSVCVARLTWKTEMEGEHAFRSDLKVEDGTGQVFQRFEVMGRLIQPVRVRVEGETGKTEADLGRLPPGSARRVPFLCYSPTRDRFKVFVDPPEEDPCVTYGEPQLIPRKELEALAKKAQTTMRCAYRVPVTVREQADGRRLDLGVIRRRLMWKTNVYARHKVSAYVNAFVEGEVGLADPQGRTFVDLGTIENPLRVSPKPMLFQLEGRDPSIQLAVDNDKTVEFLKAELLDGKEGKPSGKGKTWRVRVRFRTDTFFRGEFPNPMRPGYDKEVSCAVVFIVSRPGEASGKSVPPRRLCVPVRGNAKSL